MAIKYQITQEQYQELSIARKNNKNKNVEKRLKALLLWGEGEKYSKIAELSGYTTHYIGELVAKYCNGGIDAIIKNHYKANNRNMTHDQEEALLEPFIARANLGQIVEVSEIKKAYEEAIGRTIDSSHGHIYTILKRNGWRKVMPRSKHPNKASEEDIEASKKLKV